MTYWKDKVSNPLPSTHSRNTLRLLWCHALQCCRTQTQLHSYQTLVQPTSAQWYYLFWPAAVLMVTVKVSRTSRWDLPNTTLWSTFTGDTCTTTRLSTMRCDFLRRCWGWQHWDIRLTGFFSLLGGPTHPVLDMPGTLNTGASIDGAVTDLVFLFFEEDVKAREGGALKVDGSAMFVKGRACGVGPC